MSNEAKRFYHSAYNRLESALELAGVDKDRIFDLTDALEDLIEARVILAIQEAKEEAKEDKHEV